MTNQNQINLKETTCLAGTGMYAAMYDAMVKKAQQYYYDNISSGNISKVTGCLDKADDATLATLENLIKEGYSENVALAVKGSVADLKTEKGIFKYFGMPMAAAVTLMYSAIPIATLSTLTKHISVEGIAMSALSLMLASIPAALTFGTYKAWKDTDKQIKKFKEFYEDNL